MRQFSLILFLVILFHLEAKQLKVNVSARSAILINADTGAILYEKDPHFLCSPASITKIATALYVLEKKEKELDQLLTASQEAVGVVSPQVRAKHPSYRLTSDGTHMELKAGEIMPLRALMYGLLLASGNDAANVIAEYVSGSVPKFVEDMNLYLREKGALATHFSNPHGLPHPEHVTTAWDMAHIMKEALKKPFFREVIKTVQYPRPQTNKHPPGLIHQKNRLIKPGPLFYPKAIGGKTGFTNSGPTLVEAAQDGERTLIAVIIYAEATQRFREATLLFETAFAEQKVMRTLLTKEYDHFTLSLKGGTTALEASLNQDLTIAYFPSEEPELKAFLLWDSCPLPIAKGAHVGEVQLKTPQGQIFKTAPLYAIKPVDKTTSLRLRESLLQAKNYLIQKKLWLLLLLIISLIVLRLSKKKS